MTNEHLWISSSNNICDYITTKQSSFDSHCVAKKDKAASFPLGMKPQVLNPNVTSRTGASRERAPFSYSLGHALIWIDELRLWRRGCGGWWWGLMKGGRAGWPFFRVPLIYHWAWQHDTRPREGVWTLQDEGWRKKKMDWQIRLVWQRSDEIAVTMTLLQIKGRSSTGKVQMEVNKYVRIWRC